MDIPNNKLLQMYTTMLRIRMLEEKVVEMLFSNEIKCPVHLYIGEEAVATGVCATLQKKDCAFGTYRSHGFYIAKGGSLGSLMSELLGKETGCSRGKGGSMHVVAPEIGILGTTAIVGGIIPPTIAVVPKIPISGATICIEPPFPREQPVSLHNNSDIKLSIFPPLAR